MSREITVNEIKKAFESCISNTKDCSECVFLGTEIKEKTTCEVKMMKITLELVTRLQAENDRLTAFKTYFDKLYGTGLDIANYHLNGELEPFDNFYESALQEMDGESE